MSQSPTSFTAIPTKTISELPPFIRKMRLSSRIEQRSSTCEEKSDPDRPVPTKMFTESMTLNVGSQVLKLDYHGLNHSLGNIYIYAPEQKVLMLVDVVFPGWAPFKDLAVAESIDGFLGAHDRVLRYDFTHFVGWHLTRRGTRKDVEIQKSHVGDIVQAAGKANGAMDFNAAFAKAASRGGKGNPYAFIDVLFDDVAQQCAHEVEKKWKGRLGGVDIFTFVHCMRMTWHQRLD